MYVRASLYPGTATVSATYRQKVVVALNNNVMQK
jgi:hypothetical protein